MVPGWWANGAGLAPIAGGRGRIEAAAWDIKLGGRSAGGCCGSSLLKAFPAINGAPLRQLKRNSGFLPALGTSGGCDGSGRGLRSALAPFGLARLTSFGLVLEALLGVKLLLPGGEDKLTSALRAFENSILVLHRMPLCDYGNGLSSIVTPGMRVR